MLRNALGYALQTMCMILVAAGPASAGDILVGGSGDGTRVVFHLKADDSISPDLAEQNQTLIVNFPHTVAEPQTIQDRFMIQSLSFDGIKAVIALKQPFTYKASFKQFPSRFVIDISGKTARETEDACPVRHFEIIPGKARFSVAMVLKEGPLPEVRATKGGRIFIRFPVEFPCTDIQRLLEGVPQLQFVGLMKMANGTTLTLSLKEPFILESTRADRGESRITFVMSTSGQQSPEARELTARSLFDAGNRAGVIVTLEPQIRSLSPGEKILLARSYWSVAFPYKMGEQSNKSLSLMNEAIREMPESPEQERLQLEYCSMLIRAGLPAEASSTISRLKASGNDDIKAEASIREMDILNRAGSYQDAYAAAKRLMMGLGGKGLQEDLKALYSATLADTYLGLNDHPKALDLYRQVLAADPDYPGEDPGIFARMGDAAFRMNDFPQARDYLTMAFNLSGAPGRQKYLLMLGDSLYQIGEKDRAIVVFSQVENLGAKGDSLVIAKLKTARIIIEKNTDERGKLPDRAFNEVMDIYETLKASEEFKDKSLASLVKVRIAQAYAKHGDWEKALETYHEVWKNTTKGDSIHHYAQVEAIRSIIERVRILYRDSRYDRIYAIYTRYKPNFIKEMQDSATLFIMGDALNRIGQVEQARSMLESSTRGDSIYKEQAFYLLFTIDVKRGKYQEALIWNTIYLSTYPKGKDAQIMNDRRGEVLYRLGSLSAALPYLEASAASGSPLALHSLSYLTDAYRRLGMPQQEQTALDRIIAFHPERVSPIIEEALYLRAGQAKKAGDFTRASSLFQTLLDAYPKSSHAPWAMYYLADIAHDQGDNPKARELLTHIIRVSKDPVLVSAARVSSDVMELNRDLQGYDAMKTGTGRK
ncbi:MAG: tetratricopeptide repeat protein [Desulfobacterota bacterium]|nr:tetratricopeptide repeat protein [Thermodesulfobacteriota bacterium]